MLRRLVVVATVGAALLTAACMPDGASEPSPVQERTRTGQAGGVTVEATWLAEDNLEDVDADLSLYPLGEFVLLALKLDTHSGDLNQIDLEQAVVLRQDRAELRPQAWVSESDDVHHRAGVLVFPRRLGDGPVELTLTVEDDQAALLWETVPST